MPDFRQSRERRIVVRSLALRLPTGTALEEHEHAWGQIVFATEGVMTINTREGMWVIPPQRAAWVPARTRHSVTTNGVVRLRTLYLRDDLAAQLRTKCAVLKIRPLLRELIVEVVRHGMLFDDDESQMRLARVLMDQAIVAPDAPLELAWPHDPRARRIATKVHESPDDRSPLAELARGSGASPRTLERIFHRETGLSFGRWRQHARVLAALKRLAAGSSVTATALDVGFSGTSAFIEMFRRVLGTTPGRYFDR